MRFTVDPWDPSYGASVEAELDRSELVALADVECPPGEWEPLDPPADVAPPGTVLFVDGVRRTDAQVWIEDDSPVPVPALCASYAAGVVCCCPDGGAHLVSAEVRRGVFGIVPRGEDVATSAGGYRYTAAQGRPGAAPAQVLSQAVQVALSGLELEVAAAARDGQDLVVVDGQLRGAVGPPTAPGPLPRALGFVKTHSRAYLPPDLNGVVARLGPGQRTPVFRLERADGSDPLLARYTWYLRLPGPPGSPWAGVARVECGGEVPVEEAVALAGVSQVTLVRFASEAYKDSRAPQNLYPIAGLERALRRRLGEPALLYRALRRAAAGS